MIGARDNLKADIRALLEEAENLTEGQYPSDVDRRLQLRRAGKRSPRRRGLWRKRSRPALSRRPISTRPCSPAISTRPGFPIPISSSGPRANSDLSNFLMWQAAYSEFVFLPMHWPDFDRQAFSAALAEFSARERRFGGVTGQYRNAKLLAGRDQDMSSSLSEPAGAVRHA